jgi:tripartite-type tricarboxylate transporter receptor subunit TctC
MRDARRLLTALVLGLLAAPALGAAPAVAQNWPTRNVRFIVTLGPGSGTDIGGRLLADRLAKKWNQSVVIENKPGGDGIVAISAFVGAKDDHILLLSPTSAFTAHPYLHDNLPYKPEDLAPIARVSNTFVGITVPIATPVNSLDELAALIRSKPGELNWANVTGANGFIFEGWLKATKLDMKKVPYRNAVDAARDLAENRVQVYQSAIAIAQPQIEAGKIKLLAVINSVRPPALPHVPTATEAGHPALMIDGLVGLFGPPSMPMALRERIAADVKAVMDSDPIIKERLTATGQLFNPGGPAEFGASIEVQRATVANAAKALGIAAKQ